MTPRFELSTPERGFVSDGVRRRPAALGRHLKDVPANAIRRRHGQLISGSEQDVWGVRFQASRGSLGPTPTDVVDFVGVCQEHPGLQCASSLNFQSD
jgi:hypothetical protein